MLRRVGRFQKRLNRGWHLQAWKGVLEELHQGAVCYLWQMEKGHRRWRSERQSLEATLKNTNIIILECSSQSRVVCCPMLDWQNNRRKIVVLAELWPFLELLQGMSLKRVQTNPVGTNWLSFTAGCSRIKSLAGTYCEKNCVLAAAWSIANASSHQKFQTSRFALFLP